jgi:hypothetical protein
MDLLNGGGKVMVEYLNRQQVVDCYPLIKMSQLEAHGANGTGPAYYRIGREYFYTPADIEDWLERFRREASPPMQMKIDVKIRNQTSKLPLAQILHRGKCSGPSVKTSVATGVGRPRKDIKPSPLFNKHEK